MSDERRDYSILMSLATREEADVAAAALRAQGVDAFLGNGHASAEMPHLTLGLGGLQIMVPTFQLAEARTLLQTRVTDWREDGADVEDDEPAPGRNRWRAWVVLFMFIGPGVLAISVGARRAVRHPHIAMVRRLTCSPDSACV